MNLKSLFLKNIAQTSDSPVALQVKKAKGLYITDMEGKRYLDLISGISVNNIGHRNPAVVKAVRLQTSKFMHTMVYGEHIQHSQVRLAHYLTSLLPENLNSVYFTNSGTEATEGAMKLAKRFTSRPNIASFKNAYHGSSQGSMSLMSDTEFTQAYRPLLPGISHLKYNDTQDLDRIDLQTAAVFVEIIQSEAGYIPGETDFLKKLRDKCHATGALLIVDEIQTGMGRTGNMFAFEKEKICPDVLLLAKGLGGGMPIGCFIADAKVMKSLSHQPVLGHLTTFGGHPVCCAAAIATLDEIIKKRMTDSVSEKEQLFRKLLIHEKIKGISGRGLMLAVNLENEHLVQTVIAYCFKKQILIDWFLFNGKSLRIAPPLIISKGEIARVCKTIIEGLENT